MNKIKRFGPITLVIVIVFLIDNILATPGVADFGNPVKYSDFLSDKNGRNRTGVAPGKCEVELPTAILGKYAHYVPKGKTINSTFSSVQFCCTGYKPNRRNSSICEPVCSSGCQNGYCVEPEVCECNQGFIKNLGGYCTPTCPIACAHGYCDFNGRCVCSSSYELDPTGKFCKPKCRQGCGMHANCTAPGICECLPGFMLSSSQVCEPVCYPNCGGGVCFKPGQCHCHMGYTLVENVCQAHCPRGCINGRCLSSNVCTCDSGYTLNTNGTECKPKCRNECKNGYCASPETCNCNKGYFMSATNKECAPNCKGCRYGKCVKPDTCECLPGWILDKRGLDCEKLPELTCPSGYTLTGDKCLPFCKSGCQSGRCILPDTCECNDGYYSADGLCKKIDSENMPVITVNANMLPNQNPCPPQYVLLNGKCHPHCSRGCQQGYCVSPEVCSCYSGYVAYGGTCVLNDPIYFPSIVTISLNSYTNMCPDGYRMNAGTCYPHCFSGCHNGYCAAPNLCHCFDGYEIFTGLCRRRHSIFNPVLSINFNSQSNHQYYPQPQPAVYYTNPNSNYPKQAPYNPYQPNVDPNYTRQPGYNPNFQPEVSKNVPQNQAGVGSELCDQKCQNGNCVYKNYCQCNYGYEHVSGRPYYICDRECGVGRYRSGSVCLDRTTTTTRRTTHYGHYTNTTYSPTRSTYRPGPHSQYNTTHGTTRGTTRGTTHYTTRGTTRYTTRGTTHYTTRGTTRYTTRGTTRGTTRYTTRAATRAPTRAPTHAPPRSGGSGGSSSGGGSRGGSSSGGSRGGSSSSGGSRGGKKG